MINRKKLLGFMAGIVILSLLMAVIITLHNIDSKRNIVNAESFASKTEAVERAKASVALLGKNVDTLEILDGYPIEGVYAIGDRERKFMVKVKKSTGELIGISSSDDINAHGPVKVSLEDANKLAKQFAEKAGVNLAGCELTTEDFGPDSPAKNLYLFKWFKVNKDVILPSSINVAVNKSTGKIASFSKTDVAVNIPIEPRIAKEKAIKLADKSLGLSVKGNKVKMINDPNASLGVSVKNGIQQLVWTIDFKFIEAIPGGEDGAGIPRFVSVLVDAQTGEIFDPMK
ncbi:MAG: hypothetical protein COW32_08765 [Candidatus Aquicultor secundus]|uniref:YcdB/YcdC repeated domain-containing protein n=1 Tax=Candidatus Aquicultor secundus TaxID=1973895 RepID=A0A2M7TA94_9ACTN|nr:YcdB/YcdC domain-containing protein [Candidatus Aquicultor secundus]NCO66490.1 hypothetical protein [Solirubrobacter sp.]OIO85858.1 MAG: hypothetical protein AUK32_06565 [Candidatus Aquicultor secundus]PIU26081.1 MAG: hypothetical protein COT10_10555 [Candidatus Aquicultor secundus]PIW21658.1 MAG: hypothetical protein COW32_08765 [Candidatus Aquicultor secundus]PIX52547.1 MAG: hypothetical protein COZ51_03580 [Candidatus Aquicultor secundus]